MICATSQQLIKTYATLTALVILAAYSQPSQLHAADVPNIVVILCDDLGYGDLECYGHPMIKTPHLNKLASEGIRFTDFYSAAPVCSPSRVGLLTGRSPNRAGVYDWIPAATGTPAPDAREQVHMRISETTIPQLLKRAGYATCMAGKWHCNSRFNHADQPQPNDFGFDHWFGTQNNAAPSHENPSNFVRNGVEVGPLEGFSCQLVVDESVQWLDNRSEPSSPFFLFMAFHEPHEPVASPKNLVAAYQEAAATTDEAHYFANVANVDHAVGRFVAALEERKLRENTIIIFTSDNGPETLKRYRGAGRSYGRADPLRGMKLHTHDAGFRVPGIVNWPGKIGRGQVNQTPTSALDLLPTFCTLGNAAVPSDLRLDGEDLASLLLNKEPLERSKPLVWAYFNALNEARVAMRHGKWKVLAQLDGGKFPKLQNITDAHLPSVLDAKLTNFEIYDMEQDVGEKENRVNDAGEEIGELQKLLIAGYKQLVHDSHVWTVRATK